MAAVWFRFRAELRSRWKAMVVIALLAGFAGGVALAAYAGARRTESAFSRLLVATRASDVLVNPDDSDGTALTSAKLRALPMVEEGARYDGRFVIPADFRTPDDVQSLGTDMVADDANAGYSFGRFNLLEGRMPDRSAPLEVVIDPLLADQRGLAPGDDLRVVAFDHDDVDRVFGQQSDLGSLRAAIDRGEVGTPLTLHVVGVGVSPDMIAVDEGFANPQIIFSPSFATAYPDLASPYWGEVVRLRRGAADIPALRRAVARLAPGEAVAFQTLPATAAKVDRAVKPQVVALEVFALVVALAGLLVVGQALARQSFLDGTDHSALRALGATRGQLFAAGMLRAAWAAIGAALLAVVLAIVASPLSPIGPARNAEPDPGLRVDWPVLVSGAVVIAVCVLALAALPAWRQARVRNARDDNAVRPSRLATAFGRSGAPVAAGVGVRMALEPGRGRTAVPVRATIASTALAIAMVVAAIVFAASLDHLVDTPRLYGWNWDVGMIVSGSSRADVVALHDPVTKLLEQSPGVRGWTEASYSEVRVDGQALPAIGIHTGRSVAPTVVDGRNPERDDEIALGVQSLDRLGVGVGDPVSVAQRAGGHRQMRVVGRIVLPGLATYPGQDKTSLGEGAVLTSRALRKAGPEFGNANVFVRFASAAAAERVSNRAIELADQAGRGDDLVVTRAQRTSDVLAYERVRTLPLLLAGFLVVLAAATVAHALVTAVRRRRREFAMLKTLGFSRRQVSSAVAWQATAFGVVALVVGVPLGVALGRWGWQFLAEDLGTVSEPIVPLAVLLVAIPVVLLALNAIAWFPGRIAARLRPATVLRSE
jgi:hypothetical protein